MSAKRARDEGAGPDAGTSPAPDDARKSKKAKHGFRVGPENLPDGPWRRKVTKIKKELITKAKVKKQYAKIKAEHQKHAAATSTPNDHPNEPGTQLEPQDDVQQTTSNPPTIHPERQAMLDSSSRPRPHPNPDNNDPSSPNPEQQQPGENQDQKPRHQRRPRKQRPDYYTKELAAAERAKKQAEERRAEFARREQERQQRIAERERYRKAMAKAKAPGRDGKPKIGRESKVLLERVKKIMGES